MKGKLVKRVVSVALAAAMVFSMTACGGGSDSGSADSGEKTKLYVVNWKDYASDDEELMAAQQPACWDSMRVHGIQPKPVDLSSRPSLHFPAFQSSEFHERYGNHQRSSRTEHVT